MGCIDDALAVGPVSLFLGIEVYDQATDTWWSEAQFQRVIDFCKIHHITTLFVKFFEVGSKAGDAQGIWYRGATTAMALYDFLQAQINVIPYGFLYGDTYGSLATEIATASFFLKTTGKLCLDMEGSYWTGLKGGMRAREIAAALVPVPGKVWLSYPADYQDNNQSAMVSGIAPCVNVYMPMVYSDYLNTTWQAGGGSCKQPTIDLSNEFGPNNQLAIVQGMKEQGLSAISLWEWAFAQANPGLVDQIGTEMRTQQPMTIVKTHSAAVIYQKPTYQVEWNESPTECGPFTASLLKYAVPPTLPTPVSSEQIDQWADAEYTKYIGPNTNTDFNGSSIENMHQFFHDAGNIHYWDIGAINDTSIHTSDIARIKRALDCGYPVAVTVLMSTVYEKLASGGTFQPYPGVGAYHIFTVVGYTSDGCLLCNDQDRSGLNWPYKYLETNLTI